LIKNGIYIKKQVQVQNSITMSKIKKGITFIVLLITVFVTNISCSTKEITGKYRTNFNSYGKFSETLTLDCKGNAILNYSGNVIYNNNSHGVWKKNKDTLIVIFDSVTNKNNKFKGEYKFIITKNKIKRMPFPRSKYKEMVRLYKLNKWNLKELPSYRKLNQIPMNHYGKTGHQYYKKIENIECVK
jgi:hypothetical protein